MKKRVLIITYYWPPSAGGGVQRWLKFSKYLPDYEWTPIIYTPDNPSYSLTDKSLLQDISPDLEVLKRPIWEPYDLVNVLKGKKSSKSLNTGQTNKSSTSSKLLSWVRGNFFIPDPRKYWVKPSVSFLKQYLKHNPVDVIITTGPPHSMHLIGLALKKAIGCKWIVDIRDPWSAFDLLDEYRVSPRNLKKYQALESEVLMACDRVIATSPSMPTQLQSFDQDKFLPITNGFDKSDFDLFSDTSNKQNLVLYHAGLMSDLRNPVNFWTALDQIIGEDSEPSKYMLHLVGVVESGVDASIQKYQHLSQCYKKEGYKDHEEVILDYQTANVLLLFVNNTANAAVNIPGKTFEYLATGKPILCFSKPDTDVAKILEQFDHCAVIDYNEEVPDIKEKLLAFFSSRTHATTSEVDKFSRSQLTADLAHLLDALG